MVVPKKTALRIAIFRSSSIGDVVLATSCLDVLGKYGSAFTVTWIGKKLTNDLLKMSYPNVNYLHLEDYTTKTALVADLKGCEMMIDLQNNLRSISLGVLFRLSFLKPVYRATKREIFRRGLIYIARLSRRNQKLPLMAYQPREYEWQRMGRLVKHAITPMLAKMPLEQVNEADFSPNLPSNLLARPQTLSFLEEGAWIAVAPGASYATKQAPISLFQDVLSELNKKFIEAGKPNAAPNIVMIGDANDRAIASQIMTSITWTGRIENLAGTLSLWESTMALKGCQFVLSNDSSTAHLAEASKTPAIVFFGPTVEGFGFAPHRAKSKAFSTPLSCRPCSKHGQQPCRYRDKKCFTAISAEAVASHAFSLLTAEA